MWWKKNLLGGRPASFSLILPHKYFLGNFLSGKFYDFLKFCGSHKTHTPLSGRITQRRRKRFNHDILLIQSNKKKYVKKDSWNPKIIKYLRGTYSCQIIVCKNFQEQSQSGPLLKQYNSCYYCWHLQLFVVQLCNRNTYFGSSIK